jgi:hypothetical protein
MSQKINGVGIPGSLPDDSYNRALLEAARHAHEDVEVRSSTSMTSRCSTATSRPGVIPLR